MLSTTKFFPVNLKPVFKLFVILYALIDLVEDPFLQLGPGISNFLFLLCAVNKYSIISASGDLGMVHGTGVVMYGAALQHSRIPKRHQKNTKRNRWTQWSR